MQDADDASHGSGDEDAEEEEEDEHTTTDPTLLRAYNLLIAEASRQDRELVSSFITSSIRGMIQQYLGLNNTHPFSLAEWAKFKMRVLSLERRCGVQFFVWNGSLADRVRPYVWIGCDWAVLGNDRTKLSIA
jgi:hypothetical protein